MLNDELIASLQEKMDELVETESSASSARVGDTGIENVRLLCKRFHLVAKQLEHRQRDREPFVVSDEYDAQDLLHALLKIHFDDVRPEEWTPSQAGAAAKMDFLLKEERIVVEVKKTRKSLSVKELGEELIVDIERYRKHPNCDFLVCFVYDPEQRLGNPKGLEADLSRDEDGLIVEVIDVQ